MPVIFLLKHQPAKRDVAVFVPISLAYVIGDDRSRRVFTVALEELVALADAAHPTELERRYAERLVQQRLHQPAFRGAVLEAYARRCTVCLLAQPSLLDAAHIVGDREMGGHATVKNGLALCKLHHAAYDRDLLGVSPDLKVHVARRIREVVDDAMLRDSIQAMHGRPLELPRRARDAPDPDRLTTRFEQFMLTA